MQLHGEHISCRVCFVTAADNKVANYQSHCLASVPKCRHMVLLLKAAKVNLVDVDQAFVLDCQLKMVRHQFAWLSRSSSCHNYWLIRETTCAAASLVIATSTTVTSTALLVV